MELLHRPGGRIAFDVIGDGPLIVLVPGMGDLRHTYRHVAPGLAALGYRVASTDLRGHGDSDPTFDSYGDQDTAGDIIALIDHLGAPAVVVGNSMGAGAAVIAAAARPDLVSALVLVGPFVRDPKAGALKILLFRAATLRWWAAAVWRAYLPTLYAGRKPSDFDEYRARVVASLRRPGYAAAFSLTTSTTHAPAEASLDRVRARTLVVMGERDPDFGDPAAEGRWIAERLAGRLVLVPDAGHYPQSQQPDAVLAALAGFLAEGAPDA